MSIEARESQKPSSEPLNVPNLMREGVKRYGGNPELMLKEHPEMIRKPMPDPGKNPKRTPLKRFCGASGSPRAPDHAALVQLREADALSRARSQTRCASHEERLAVLTLAHQVIRCLNGDCGAEAVDPTVVGGHEDRLPPTRLVDFLL